MKKDFLPHLLLSLYFFTILAAWIFKTRYLLIPLTGILTLLVLGLIIRQTFKEFPHFIFIILLSPIFSIFAAYILVKSHFLLLILSACLISVVLCILTKQEKKQRIRFAVIMFFSLVLFTLAAAWIMYFLRP